MEKKWPPVSVIIAVRNGSKTIRQSLKSVAGLAYPNYEIIVVDDGSRDNTFEILKDFTGKIKLLHSNGSGPSKARNLGIKAAKGEYVAFTDADCIVDKNWLNALLAGFDEEGNVGGVGGIQLSPEDDTDFGKRIHGYLYAVGFLTDYMKSSRQGEIVPADHNPTCNVMYKRTVFDKAGFFEEGLWPGEDVELDYRVRRSGYGLRFNPEAKVYHFRPGNMHAFLRMMFSYGRVQAYLVRKYGFFRTLHFIPLVVLLSAYGLVLLLYFSLMGFIIALLAGVTANYLFFLLKRLPLTRAFSYATTNMAAFFSWNFGFFVGLFK